MSALAHTHSTDYRAARAGSVLQIAHSTTETHIQQSFATKTRIYDKHSCIAAPRLEGFSRESRNFFSDCPNRVLEIPGKQGFPIIGRFRSRSPFGSPRAGNFQFFPSPHPAGLFLCFRFFGENRWRRNTRRVEREVITSAEN